MPTVIEGAVTVTGRLTPKQLDIPAESLTDAGVSSSAGIGTAKLKHRYRAGFNQPNTTATSETRVVHVARVAGTVRDFKAGSIAACAGAAEIELDLKKNGTTVLSSTLVLDNANTNRVAVSGTLNPASVALVAGDVLEIVTTATAGGGTLGTGLFASVEVDEDPV